MRIEASNSGKQGKINLLDTIGFNSASSSQEIRRIVEDFLSKGIETVEVYINCRGGSTIEAVEICNELNRLPSVTLIIGSIAASAATYIMTKFVSKGYENSMFMIHRPKLTTSGDVNQLKADIKLLENVQKDYAQSYATKMKKTVEEIEEFFKKGDFWMTANEALELNLLDEIIKIDSPTANLDFEPNNRLNWTLEDYQTKDVAALEIMMINEPEKFQQLENDYFGTTSNPTASKANFNTSVGLNRDNWTLEDYQTKDVAALERMMIYEPEKFQKLENEYFKTVSASEKMTPQWEKASKDKNLMKRVKKQMLENLTEEELEEFKQENPEHYKLIMES